MTLEDDTKFKEKLTCGLKNNRRNLLNFHAISQNSGNLNFDRVLLSKAYIVWAKNSTKELFLMILKSDAKFEEKLTLS